LENHAGKQRSQAFCEADIIVRKVAGSGHISYKGRSYFVSKALVGKFLRVIVTQNQLIIDTTVPFHKELPLHKKNGPTCSTDVP
jgi:hypothetical protein